MESNNLLISNNQDFQHKLIKLKSQEISQPAVWHLTAGIYNLQFQLPPFLKIKGAGVTLTTIKIKDTCMLESNNVIEDLTLEYSYLQSTRKSNDVFQLFVINCVSYLDQYERPDDLVYHNTVIFRNCDIKLFNLESTYVFNILVGNLKLDNVKLTHNIYEWETKGKMEVHNLFTLNYLCELELVNCDITYQTKTTNTFLISGNIASIKMKHSTLILESNLNLEDCYLFYLISTRLNLQYSKVENLVSNGKIFFWDVENELEFKNLISNFEIQNGTMSVKKIGESKNSWRLVSFLSGFLYLGEKYIFDRILELEEEFRIDLFNSHLIKDVSMIVEPDISLLFLVSMDNCFLLDKSSINFEEELPHNYILEIQNLTYQNGIKLTQINQLRNIKNIFNYDDGTLEIEKLKVGNLSSLQLHQIFQCDQGYSLLDKTQVGNQSIDLTLGNSNITGAYNFAGGLDIKCEGHHSIVLGKSNYVSSNNGITIGNNLTNKFDNCIVLGKYNTEKLDRDAKLLVIGNGNSQQRSDALIILENGDMKVKSNIEASKITDGICSIEEGNILGVQNIEIEGNVYVNQTLEVEGKIQGYSYPGLGIPGKVLEIAGDIISIWQLDLSSFDSPATYGKIMARKNNQTNFICCLDETIQGLIYEMEVICLETPSRQDVRFIVSRSENLRNEIEGDFIDIISSYEWCKGKRMLEREKIKFDWNYEIPKYYLYLAREIETSMYQDIGAKKLTGKFLVRTRGTSLF